MLPPLAGLTLEKKHMTNWADARVVEAAAAEWTNAQVACRANGHAWRPQTVTHYPGVYVIRQRCSRNCGCYREAEMNEQGYLTAKWKMIYPKTTNYLLVDENGKSIGRVDQEGRARIRLASIRNVTIVEGTFDV